MLAGTVEFYNTWSSVRQVFIICGTSTVLHVWCFICITHILQKPVIHDNVEHL